MARDSPINDVAELKGRTFAFENVTKPWLARSGLEPRILNALGSALLDTKDPRALRALGKTGFLPGSDHDYEIVRRAVKGNNEFYSLPAGPT